MNPLTGVVAGGATSSLASIETLACASGETEASVEGEANVDDDTNTPGTKEAAEPAQFLLLGQEEYLEHRAPLCLLALASVGGRLASCDTQGVIKVWTSTPETATLATFISGSPGTLGT